MEQRLLHTPEGVRDIYNDECERKLTLQDRMHRVLKSYGCRDIETPTFEFFDVFSKEVGTIPSRDLYKFFDREGNTLVLRPDITPSIARAAAKYFEEEDMPARLCYIGNTFINNSSYQGRLKETTQLGAELIGDNSPQADAEILAMVIESLQKAGLKEFQVSIGHVDFYKSLFKEAGFDEEQEETLKELISNKNNFGVEEFLEGLPVSSRLSAVFARLPQMFGSVEILNEARRLTDNEGALHAVDRLQAIYEILCAYGVEKYVSFDLGMLNKYMYYTGVIFRGYTYGTGDAVLKGGRYDRLLGHFGKEAASIGFVVMVDQLLNTLTRQKICLQPEEKRRLVFYSPSRTAEAVRLAKKLRMEGAQVVMLSADSGRRAETFAGKHHFDQVYSILEDGEIKTLVMEQKQTGGNESDGKVTGGNEPDGKVTGENEINGKQIGGKQVED